MYLRIRRSSSALIIARTRIWRTTARASRGERSSGGLWQRPHCASKRFSPSLADVCFDAAADEPGFPDCVVCSEDAGCVGVADCADCPCTWATQYKNAATAQTDKTFILTILIGDLRAKEEA
jgi:hypothetical protein